MSRAGAGDSALKKPRVRLLVQLVGFCIGLGLLGWCIALALAPENREQFQELRNASAGQIAGMLVLSLAYLIINGLIFWIVLRPAHRLRAIDVLAVNGIATFLTYLPFKLSALFRVAIHNRRDRVPLLTIGSWFASTAVLMLAAIGPAALAAVLWQQIDLIWLLLTLAGQVLVGGALLLAARAFRGREGQARLASLVSRLRVALLSRMLGSRAWSNLHAGFDMIASPRTVALAIGLRLLDVAVQAGRFAFAAAIFGLALPFEEALLISLAYFMVGVLSPFGVVGAREIAAVGMANALGAEIADAAAAAAVVLLVSATEGVVLLLGAALGTAWLRPDRLLRPRPDAEMDQQSRSQAAPGKDDGLNAPEPARAGG